MCRITLVEMESCQTISIDRFQQIVGVEYVFSPIGEYSEWCKATYTTSARPMFVVRPINNSEIVEIIKLCHKNHIEFETISLGYNWGYGSKTPSLDRCIQISLDRMKKIQIDEFSNSVLIESGVSQVELCNYLRATDSDYTMSVSGSSPNSSILGNALTGGYGNGIHTVRWNQLRSFKVINCRGEIQDIFPRYFSYRSRLA